MKYIMQCTRCHSVFTDDEVSFVCPTCTHPLNINIIHNKVGMIKEDFFLSRTESMWKFLSFLPLKHHENIISLGEGNTPFIRSNNLAKDLGIPHLWMKNETTNPTGSFHDRQISLGVSIAKEMNINKVISLSTGNVGVAVAAYSTRAGFQNLVVVPNNFKRDKINQIRLFGGNVRRFTTLSYQALMDVVIQAARQYGAMNLATTSLYNAFTNHGAKTIIYEIFEQMNLKLPELIVVPVGGAGLLSALIQACMELKELSFIEDIPHFLAVQPEGCHPFIDALRVNAEPKDVYAKPWKFVNTVISALANDIPFDYSWFHQLHEKLEPGTVSGIIVSDEEALASQRDLSRGEGIFVELASSTTLAALKKAKEHGDTLEKFEDVALILTGAGVLDMDTASKRLREPEEYALERWEEVMHQFFG